MSPKRIIDRRDKKLIVPLTKRWHEIVKTNSQILGMPMTEFARHALTTLVIQLNLVNIFQEDELALRKDEEMIKKFIKSLEKFK